MNNASTLVFLEDECFTTELNRVEAIDKEQSEAQTSKLQSAAYRKMMKFRKHLPSYEMKDVSIAQYM